jgi:hypothetical protein
MSVLAKVLSSHILRRATAIPFWFDAKGDAIVTKGSLASFPNRLHPLAKKYVFEGEQTNWAP